MTLARGRTLDHMREPWKSRWAAMALALASLSVSGGSASAEQNQKKKPPVPPSAPAPVDNKSLDVPAARGELVGGDVDKAIAAAQRLATTRNPAALEALLDGLALGLHPRVAAAAIDAVATF